MHRNIKPNPYAFVCEAPPTAALSSSRLAARYFSLSSQGEPSKISQEFCQQTCKLDARIILENKRVAVFSSSVREKKWWSRATTMMLSFEIRRSTGCREELSVQIQRPTTTVRFGTYSRAHRNITREEP